MGSRLPRDAWMQHRDGQNVGKFPEEARPGDLYFFSDSGSKITHVGIALGNSRIIHARGRVRYDSMDPDQAEFNRDLADTLVEIGTYF
ncbi:MAG: hypothetical protein E4H13_13915 [Calditrichales bacterium]|nr:MAG: hypothetical protein E4H13_13915 [Calditrichales bacterium]